MSKLIPNPKAEDKRNIVNNSQNAGNNNQNNRNNNNNQNRRNQGGHPQQQQRNDRGHNRNNGSGTYNLPDQTRNDDGYRQWKTNLPLMGAPTLELPEKPKELVKKFTGRCRLFVANLPSSITEDGLKELFSRFGEVSEVFLGKQNAFAFVKMDTRKNAEAARTALDLSTYENRTLRVRLAAHAAAVRVSNLSSMVSNDLLEYAFSYFGEVERAVVIADDRGRSTGEGIVEFARKSSALNALKRCQGENFILTAIPQPVVVEPFEEKDDEEGVADRHLNKNTVEYRLEREVGPRFADPGTFEYEFASRWKELFKLEKAKKERLDIEIQEARTKLREQMEYAKVEHQTKALREKLREMEEKTLSYGHIRESRAAEEKRREDERQRDELLIRQREEEILRRQQMGDYGNIRRQETDLMREANALQDLLDKVCRNKMLINWC